MNVNQDITGGLQRMQIKLLDSAGFNGEALTTIRKVFGKYARNDESMDFEGFQKFARAYPDLFRDINRIDDYFGSFDELRRGRLTLPEFCLGLAALDPRTNHGGETGELRCHFIFRFYCRSTSGVMDADAFRSMAKDVVLCKKPDLINKPGDLELGAASLFASTPVNELSAIASKPATKNTLTQTDPHFRILDTTVRISGAGCVVEKLSDVKGLEIQHEDIQVTVTQNTAEILEILTTPVESARSKAISVAREVLRGLDYFYRPYTLRRSKNDNVINGDQKIARKPECSWYDVKRPKLAACLISLCRHVQALFAAEPRCLQLRQPIFVLGDLHGNYRDLHEFERLFWPMGPEHSIADILFLGDYVDRGDYGVEVVSYLFALKLLAPEKVFLLRGNHELREQQLAFNFHVECNMKFGDNDGQAVWSAINSCFDYMPLAAVIDGKIFCSHGGVPHSKLLPRIQASGAENVATIINAQCPIPAETFSSNSLGWELMWNDPLWSDEECHPDIDGFCMNGKRGTGCMFTPKALDNFLTRFNLSHVVRAHQVQAAGFQLRYSAKLLTVFSSSSYGGLENQAGCLIVNNNYLKLVRISSQTVDFTMEKENDRKPESNLDYRNIGMFIKRTE